MNLDQTKTVRELALEDPAAPRVLESLGIDYCCGGGKSLAAACREQNLSTEQVLEAIASAAGAGKSAATDRDWQKEPLAELIEHIRTTHHKYTREEIARLNPLLAKVAAKHGKNHPELVRIQAAFSGLAQELDSHLMKEERVLFPYIQRLEESTARNQPAAPVPFGTVRNPVSMMIHGHDSAGAALRAMREASGNYTAPADACTSYQTLYRALAEFEADLHQHIHLENNILFPRAIQMEQQSESR